MRSNELGVLGVRYCVGLYEAHDKRVHYIRAFNSLYVTMWLSTYCSRSSDYYLCDAGLGK